MLEIKATLFDLDDTLFLTSNSKEKIIDKAVELFGIERPRIAKHISKLYKIYGFSEDEKVLRHIFSNFLTEIQHRQLIEENENHTRKIMKHVKSIISDLNSEGLKIGVISNCSSEESATKIKLLEIEKYIDFVITPSNFFEKKPSIVMFIKAINTFGISPNKILYVGNDPILDMLCGRYTGMKTLLIKQFMKGRYKMLYVYKLFMPNYTLERIHDIPALVAKLIKQK